jgi:hypothetical protein
VRAGDLVKFSRAHTCSPGLEYCKDWIGVIIKSDDREVSVMWTIHGDTHIAEYDERWWSRLRYKPLEVISER